MSLHQPLLLFIPSSVPKGSSSTWQASLTLFKAVVGTGIFALPPAIRAAGWVCGSAVVLLIASLSGYTMCLIVGSVQELRQRGVPSSPPGTPRGHGNNSIEYQDLTLAAFPQLNGPITFLCMLVNYGGVLGFYDFIVANIRTLAPALERWHILLCVALIDGPLSLLRSTGKHQRSKSGPWHSYGTLLCYC